jgi:lipoprotein signal peptidase
MAKNKTDNISFGTIFCVIIFFVLLQIVPFFYDHSSVIINDRFILGFFPNSNTLAIFFLVVATFLSIILLKKNANNKIQIFKILFLASVLSNLSDRVFHAGVIDYFFIGQWPTFNIADVLIIIGIVLLAINYFSSNK